MHVCVFPHHSDFFTQQHITYLVRLFCDLHTRLFCLDRKRKTIITEKKLQASPGMLQAAFVTAIDTVVVSVNDSFVSLWSQSW